MGLFSTLSRAVKDIVIVFKRRIRLIRPRGNRGARKQAA